MLSPEKVVAIYCIIDDILKASDYKFDKRAKLSESEILTLSIIAMLYFGGVYSHALAFLVSHGYFTKSVCKSRLHRRLIHLEGMAQHLFNIIAELFTGYYAHKEFIIDSTPLEVCDNIRIQRCRMLQGEAFRGYKASFRRYFYGLKLQLVTTKEGVPVSYSLTEASLHDSQGMQEIKYKLSAESKVYADAAYTDYKFEEDIEQNKAIAWLSQRKRNAKAQRTKQQNKQISKARKRIETVFSQLKDMFKRKIHAVTIEGYMRKIKYFILAFQLKFII